MDRNIVAGGETRYGLDGLGIESRCRRECPHPSRPALGSTQPPKQWVPCHSRVVKWTRGGFDHPLHVVWRCKKV